MADRQKKELSHEGKDEKLPKEISDLMDFIRRNEAQNKVLEKILKKLKNNKTER